MTAAHRLTKQILILVVFCALVYGAGFGISHMIARPTPTPTPDPRAGLAPIQVLEVTKLTVGELDYDVLVKVRNPNTEYGSGYVPYALFADGTKIMEGVFSTLPGQTQYLVISPVKTMAHVDHFDVQVTAPDWQKLDPLAAQAVNFVVSNLVYANGKLAGNVFNTTDFDMNKIEVVGILFDAADKPIAINRTDIRTFIAHTKRGFEMSWSAPIRGVFVRGYAEAHVNVFENDNFIRTLGSSSPESTQAQP